MYRAQLSPEQKVTRMMAAKDILKNIESYVSDVAISCLCNVNNHEIYKT